MHVEAGAAVEEADRGERVVRDQAELRPMVRRLHGFVRVGLDAGGHPHERPRDSRGRDADGFVERVHDEQRVLLGRELEQAVLLVVAVDDEPLARDPGAACERQLADRRDVGAEPLLAQQPEDGDGRERLRAVGDQRLGGSVAIGARLRPQRRLVVDDERRAEAAGKLDGGDAAEHQLGAR